MKKICKTYLTIVVITLFVQTVNAQPGFEDDVDDVPVDGGVALLIMAGTVYGIKNRLATYKKV